MKVSTGLAIMVVLLIVLFLFAQLGGMIAQRLVETLPAESRAESQLAPSVPFYPLVTTLACTEDADIEAEIRGDGSTVLPRGGEISTAAFRTAPRRPLADEASCAALLPGK